MTACRVTRGNSPIILCFPHVGTHVPADIRAALSEEGRVLRDTDWHIDRLYEGLLPDVTLVKAQFHRYVIDANRDPAGHSLYPGQTTTELVPRTNFDNIPIWQEEPDNAEIARRIALFHTPYHRALQGEIDRLHARHGGVILIDCHSIRSHIPWLFEGKLPVFNIGTDMGRTCDTALEQDVYRICAQSGFSHVLNGRFRGGWTTRHYGQPQNNIHALQIELVQSAYLMDETPPFAYSPDRAAALRVHLAVILAALPAHAKRLCG